MKKKLALLALTFFVLVTCRPPNPPMDIELDPKNPQVGQRGHISWVKLANGDYQFDYTGLGIDPKSTNYFKFDYASKDDFSNYIASVGFDIEGFEQGFESDVWFASWEPTSTGNPWNTYGYALPEGSNCFQPIIPVESGFKLGSIKSTSGYIAYNDGPDRKISIEVKGVNDGNGDVTITNVQVYVRN